MPEPTEHPADDEIHYYEVVDLPLSPKRRGRRASPQVVMQRLKKLLTPENIAALRVLHRAHTNAVASMIASKLVEIIDEMAVLRARFDDDLHDLLIDIFC